MVRVATAPVALPVEPDPPAEVREDYWRERAAEAEHRLLRAEIILGLAREVVGPATRAQREASIESLADAIDAYEL